MGPAFPFQNYQEGHLKCEFISIIITRELYAKCILWLEILVCDISSFWHVFYHVGNLFVL